MTEPLALLDRPHLFLRRLTFDLQEQQQPPSLDAYARSSLANLAPHAET